MLKAAVGNFWENVDLAWKFEQAQLTGLLVHLVQGSTSLILNKHPCLLALYCSKQYYFSNMAS